MTLDSLTFQRRRYFVLPWEEQGSSAVRFVDRGFLSRKWRVVLGLAAWVCALACAYLIWLDLYYLNSPGTNHELVAAGTLLAIAGAVIFRWCRTRTIEVDAGGLVRFRTGPRSEARGGAEPASPGRLELSPVWCQVYRDSWRAFALLLTNDHSRVALCFAPTAEDSLDILGTMPTPIRELPMVIESRPIIASIHLP